jgi:hypothetical protein
MKWIWPILYQYEKLRAVPWSWSLQCYANTFSTEYLVFRRKLVRISGNRIKQIWTHLCVTHGIIDLYFKDDINSLIVNQERSMSLVHIPLLMNLVMPSLHTFVSHNAMSSVKRYSSLTVRRTLFITRAPHFHRKLIIFSSEFSRTHTSDANSRVLLNNWRTNRVH